MNVSRNRIRNLVLGLLVVAGFVFAPVSFARSHWNVGVNIGLPGISLGWSDCRHCGHGWGGNYYYGASYYSPYYAPAYYAPAYYAPAYYSYPAYYGSVRYYDRPYYRGHYTSYRASYRGGYDRGGRYYQDRGRDGYGDYGRRASYYDRGYGR